MLAIYLNHIRLLAKIAIVFLVAIFVVSFSQKTFAATGILKQINFQGKVVNANGTNVANGNYDFVFNIYTVSTGGTAIWTETRNAANQVTVTDGIFRVSLGSITAFPGSVDFNTDNIYLGINFNSDGEMTPRVQFTAVPYAFNALKVAGLTVTDTTGTFTLAAAKTLTVNNTLTFAGTDATTITFQGTDTYVGRATTDTLTNKTIGSTGLTFSAASTDITTASNEDLTLTPNGTGNTIITSDFNSGVLVGSSSNTLAPFSVTGGIGSNALLILNQTNSGDLITASASGTTKFRIANNGDAVLAAALNVGGTNGTSTQCLLGGSSASWGSCSAAAGSNWDIVNGVITPKLTSTLDFLLGSAATSSAKFAVLNINSGTPTATISATTTGLSLSASGTIQSLQNATLTIGGNTTGNIILSPLSGSGTVSSTGDVDLSTGKVFRIAGTSTLSSTVLGSTVTSSSLQTLGTISTGVWQGTAVGGGFGGTGVGTYATGDLLYAGSVNPTSLSKLAVGNTSQVLGVSAGVPAWIDPSTIGAIFQIVNGSAQLKNTTLDLLLGATASTSAKFAVLNINSGTPTATISANSSNNATTLTGLGVLGTTNAQTLTLGNSTTGEILLAPGGTTALTARGANLIGGGTLTGLTGLTSSGTITFSGFSTVNGLLFTNGSGVLAQTAQGASNTVLHGNGPSVPPTFSAVALASDVSGILPTANGGSFWNSSSGALYPGNATLDVLIGATSTSSAKFGFINVSSGIPTATISGNIVLDAAGILQTTKNQTLTLGGNSTGNIIFSPNNGTSGLVTVNSNLNLSSGSVYQIAGTSVLSGTTLGTGVLTSSLTTVGTIGTGVWQGTAVGGGFGGTGVGTYATGDLLYAGSVNPTSLSKLAVGNTSQVLGVSAGVPAWIDPSTIGAIFQIVNGSAQLKNTTLDLLLGATASTSAKFAVLNINSGTPTATISANSSNNATTLTGLGVLGTTNAQTLTLGNSTTGEVLLAPGGTTALTARGTNLIGTGTLTGLTGLTVASGTVSLPSGQIDNVELANSSITVSATAGTGISITGSPVSLGGTLTVAGIDASTSVKGVASFNTANFAVATGDVTIKSGGVTTTEIAQNTIDFADISDNPTLDGTTTIALGTGTQNFNLVLGTNATNGNIVIQPNAGGQAALIVNKTGVNDIFTASASGTTRFTVNNSGDLIFGSTTRLTNAGVGTFITGTVLGSQTFTTNNIADSGALTIKSGGTSALTLDTSGAAAINIGNTNATSIALGNATTNPTLTLTGSGLTTLGGGLTFSGTTARTITGPNTGAANALTITTAGNISGLTLNTAAGSSGNSGAITIATGGTSVSGTSGAVTIDVGAGVTANGSITIGGTNASALTIGRAGVTTTVNGTLTANTLSSSGVTITGGSINSTTIGATTPSTGAFTTLSSTGATTAGNNTATVVIDGTNFDVSSAGTVTLAASQSYTGAGAVTLSSGGTSGLTFDSASGDITVAANDGLTFAATTLGNNGSRNVTINSGTGGTTATLIVKLDTSGTVVTTDTTTLNNAVGVALNTTTVGGAVRVAINGVVTATADNAVTAGDYIGVGTTTAGRAKSLGTTYPSTAGVQVIGRALGTQATPGSTFLLMLNGLDNNVAAGGGGGYNLIKDETVSLTARTTLAFLGTAVTCADNASLTQTECTMSGAGGAVSFASGTPDNTATSNNLIHLQKSGVNRFVVSNAGGLTINGTDSSVVRTTTGAGTGATDFGQTGAVLTNLTNANDQLELSDGTAGNGTITTAGQPAVNVAVGAGAQAITRADGKYQVIVGGGTALTTYDSIAGTFTASAQLLTGAAGAGALSLPRPDGRYRVIHGGGLTTTSLVDPNGVVAVGASVAVNASGNGTVAYRRANGRYLVTNGGAATTQIYNPVTDAFVAGPSTSGAVVIGAGALVLPRPDGQALIVTGGAVNPTLTTQLYNPNSAAGDIGVFAVGPALPTGCGTNAAGSIGIRKQDGKYIVFSQVNASAIYDPVANTWAQNGTSCTTPLAGKGPTVALADGAHAIPMQDGKFLIIIGGASTVANIYDPSTDTFTAHATAITAGGAGRHSIMRANGTWQLISGGGTATNNFDTALPVSGTYQSDDISSTSLNASSTLKWTAQYETPFVGTNAAANTAFSTLQFLVRTAVNAAGCTTPLNSATDRELLNYGDFIRPGSTDNCIRMTVKFNRPLPKRIFDERGTWMGNGNTVTRLDFTTPTLFDISVDNSTVLRRNNFQFTEPNAQTAAPQNETSGPVMTRVEAQTDRLYLPYGRLSPANQFLTGGLSSGLYPGVISGAHPNLPVTTTDGTVVIARPDRTFLVMSAAAANAAIYDPASSTFTAQAGAGNIPTAAVGAGAFALKRPDGKFLVVLGGAATTTNIYDPNAASGSRFVAGPALIAAAGSGAMAIQNTDGTFTIVHGGAATTSSIYDPVRNTTLTGPATPVATNCGAWAIPRPTQNQYLVFHGIAAGVIGGTATFTYDATTKIFSPTTGSPALPLASGCGSFAFQRQDGLWVIMAGGGGTAGAGQTVGFLYNPAQNIITTLGLTFTAVQRGAHVIPRADGTFLIINGNAAVTTNLYIPWGGAYLAAGGPAGTVIIGTAAPAPPVTQTAVGAGGLSFQRPDGKWVIIVGGAVASAVTNLYDAGWYPDGQYLSEQVSVPALAANSTLEWKQTPDNFVRMEIRVAASQAALGNAAYFTVGRPGQSIVNAGGETWVQVEVNLRRDFPTFCNNLDGVYASTGGMAYCNRSISTPTVFEYKLNNGMDLLNLQVNGLNMLRVTSGGGIYSAQQGGFYAGGADLAENYTSSDSLEKGEVVSIDSTNSHGVKRSSGQYQNNVLGVVSTAPGFVAGAYTEDSYPIALVGRVPVKVSSENGVIKTGDYLTASSVPGYAMKATMAGRVLGKALEDLKDAKECPAFGMGNLPSTKCGEVMMFVNLTDYLGQPVELAMAEKDDGVILANEVRPESDSGVVAIAPPQNDNNKEGQILAFLKQLKEERDASQYASEVFTDRVSAVNEIITPHVITELLTAKKIKADSIEGLEILTSKISGLAQQVAGLSTQSDATSSAALSTSEESSSATSEVTGTGSSDGVVKFGYVEFESAKVSLDLTVLGKLNANGGLVVLGPSEFKGESLFDKLATFISHVIFKDDVTFLGRPTFNKDTAGFAVIEKDADFVDVAFEKEYETTPIVSTNFTFDEFKKEDRTADDQSIRRAKLFDQEYTFMVVNRTKKGFTIVLNKKATEDITLSWVALAIKDAKTSLGKKPVPTETPQPSPTASAGTATPQATTEPSISPAQETSASSQ